MDYIMISGPWDKGTCAKIPRKLWEACIFTIVVDDAGNEALMLISEENGYSWLCYSGPQAEYD